MIKTRKKTKETSNVVPTSNEPAIVTGEQNEPITYVVTRDGIRVSEKEYESATAEDALSELDFWKKIINKFPDGTNMSIVKYDKKKHRIW